MEDRLLAWKDEHFLTTPFKPKNLNGPKSKVFGMLLK
jgi:hypothetical protein